MLDPQATTHSLLNLGSSPVSSYPLNLVDTTQYRISISDAICVAGTRCEILPAFSYEVMLRTRIM
jgi:hypothetical protein